MTLILQGTDNSVSSPAVQGGTAGTTTGVYYPASNQLALATNGAQALLINASQNIGINVSAPVSRLTIFGTSGLTGAEATYPGTIQISEDIPSLNATGGLEFKNSVFGSGYGVKLAAIDPGSNPYFSIGARSNSATWVEQLRVDSSSNLNFKVSNAGIVFNNSSATTNSTLNDYETGTWTPTVGGGTTNPTVTYTSRQGRYTKIGNIVYVYGYIYSAGGLSGGSGGLIISGLPFTVASTPYDYAPIMAGYNALAGSYGSGVTRIQPVSSTATANYYYSSNSNTQLPQNGVFELSFAGCYLASF